MLNTLLDILSRNRLYFLRFIFICVFCTCVPFFVHNITGILVAFWSRISIQSC